MANRFLNNITINDQYTFPSSDGTDGQILSTTGAADGTTELVFVDQSTINAGNAEHVVIYAKNTHTASIAKGTPVYITGTVGATDTVEIAPADASNSAKMPAVGLLDDTLAVNDFGYVITGGFMDNITTDPIDGATPSSNDTVYVKAGGGLTLTKPTGSNLIQNVAKVGKVSGGNSGSLIVSSILRTNDVPNLTTGKIWVGTASNTAESTVVHLDETNNRLGVNQTSPIGAVHILGPNTNPAMTTSALVVEQGDGAKILIDGNDIDAAAGMLYLNDYSTNDVVFGGQIRVGGGGSPVGNSWFANGNVGIGTTSPAYTLDVNGTLHSSNITLADGIYHEGDTNTYINFLTDQIQMATAGSVRAYINSLGNVGIGTTSPSNRLHVSTSDDVVALFQSTDAISRVEFADNNTTGSTRPSIGASGNNTIFTQGSTERMRIDSSGNVGIGTTSPSEKLEVAGKIKMSENSSYPVTIKNLSANANAIETNTALEIIAGNNYGISFKDGSTTNLTINGYTGNVGVATTNPSQKLHVNGTALVSSTLFVGSTNNAIYNYITSLIIQAGSGSSISLGGGPGNVANNVGIGNGNLNVYNGILDVNGTIRGKNYLYLEDTTGNVKATLRTESTYSTLDHGTNTFNTIANAHIFLRGFTEIMRVHTNNNVGIGTSSPGEKLEVNGTVKATAATDAYKGYIKSIITTGYSMKSASTAYQYIPYNSYTLTTLQAYYNRTVAAYNGRVKKIIVKRIDGASADATGMKFKKEINGTVIATEYTATVLSGSGNFQATYNFANNDFTFSAGDSIGVLMQSSGGTGMIGAGAIQIVLEYNIT